MVLANATITAGTALTLWYLLRRLGLALRWAGVAAVLYGTATTAWFYALTFMREPLTGLCLLLAVAGVRLAGRREGRWWLLVSGLAAGLLVATRPFNLLVLPIVGVYLLLRFHRDPAALALWGLPVIGVGLGFAGYNAIRFGSILETGYRSEAQAFSAAIFDGAFGLLLSPGKGLAFYSPIVLLGLVGLPAWWRRERPLLLAAGAICAVFLAGYSQFVFWWGGGSWGPRFLVPLIPLLMIAAGFGLPVLWHSRPGRAALIGLASLSVVLQIGGVLIDFGVYWEAMRAWHGGFSEYENPAFVYRQIYDPVFSPLLGHLWLLVTGHRWVVAGTMMNSLSLTVVQIAAFIGGVLLCGMALWGFCRLDRQERLVETNFRA